MAASTIEHRVVEVGPQDTALLAVLVEHEAVVPVRSARDLGRRLAHDRRVLAVLDEDLSGPVDWGPPRHPDGRLQDPVVRFHLGNGATVRDVLVSADCSWHGLEQSLGVMVSYQYVPAVGDAGLERVA